MNIIVFIGENANAVKSWCNFFSPAIRVPPALIHHHVTTHALHCHNQLWHTACGWPLLCLLLLLLLLMLLILLLLLLLLLLLMLLHPKAQMLTHSPYEQVCTMRKQTPAVWHAAWTVLIQWTLWNSVSILLDKHCPVLHVHVCLHLYGAHHVLVFAIR